MIECPASTVSIFLVHERAKGKAKDAEITWFEHALRMRGTLRGRPTLSYIYRFESHNLIGFQCEQKFPFLKHGLGRKRKKCFSRFFGLFGHL